VAVARYEAFLAGCYEKAEEVDDSNWEWTLTELAREAPIPR
jgi:hypothetical protein